MNWMLAAIALLLAQAAPTPWVAEVTKDPMTDDVLASATVSNQDGFLSFVCSSGKSEPFFMVQPKRFLGGRMGSHDHREVTYRFDENAAVSRPWKYYDRYAAISARKEMEDFARGLAAATSHVRLRLRTFDGGLIDLKFPVEGVRAAMVSTVKACQPN